MKNGSDTSRTKIDHEAGSLTLSRPAKQRFKWIEHFRRYRNARLTCRHFGISPDTFYLWRKRFNPQNLLSLEDNKKSRKPHKVRKPKYTLYQIEAVKKLKVINPKIGKNIIARILKETGVPLSASSVSRILKQQKETRDKQIKAMQEKFIQGGGFTENLFRARLERKKLS